MPSTWRRSPSEPRVHVAGELEAARAKEKTDQSSHRDESTALLGRYRGREAHLKEQIDVRDHDEIMR